MDSLRAVKYQHAKSIRLWKTVCEDEGVRSICAFIKDAPNLQVLELLDNDITRLGCEFLSKVLTPSAKLNIVMLKLDHNSFGSAGMTHLAEGLCQNKIVTNISLTYCDIDSEGAKALF